MSISSILISLKLYSIQPFSSTFQSDMDHQPVPSPFATTLPVANRKKTANPPKTENPEA